MAGSGKTTLMQRINSHLHMQRAPSYIINLDPAVANTPYDPNIDIRDTVGARAQCFEHGLQLMVVLSLRASRCSDPQVYWCVM